MANSSTRKTITTVIALKAFLKSGVEKDVPLGNGLYVRKATGRFFVRYRVRGDANAKVREYTLPKPYGEGAAYTSWTEARNIADEILLKARIGIDYIVELAQQRRDAEIEREEKEAARRAAKEAEAARLEQERMQNLTVGELFNTWIADGVRRKDGNAELKRSFHADVLPKIGQRPVRLVTEHDIRSVLRAQVERGVNRTAVATRNNLTQMFSWAEKRQPWRKLLADGNPVDLIDIRTIVSLDYDINNVRDRVLSSAEVRELHRKFIDMRAEYDAAPNKRTALQPVERTTEFAIWLMLATMCRVGELSMSQWKHVNLDTGEWFIPKENVKDEVADHIVYLSDFALKKFRQLHEHTGKSKWCFPAMNKESHVCVKSISKQIGDRQTMFKKDRSGNPRKPMKHRSKAENALVLAEGKNGAWTPHDLRRTGATIMQSLGVSLDIIDRCQNHVLHGSKVRRHYMHHDYAKEKREAWRQLGEHLDMLTSTNVVPMFRAA